MVHSFLPVPFADAARQQLFAAVEAALRAESNAPATVLLGNLEAFTPVEADALLVRSGWAALLVLTPHGGHLTMPALAYGAWRLDGLPLPDRANADNPFEQYRQQRPAVLAWLREQLDARSVDLQGIALFGEALSFGPEVESQLHQHPAAVDFQLVGGAVHLPARLRALQPTPAAGIPEPELLAWANQLAAALPNENSAPAYQPTAYLAQKLQQLWSWLGAEDIPSDPPYGGISVELADQQERARLQQLRQELQAELSQQRQEAAARETTRTQELMQLRHQLAQAGLSAAERRAEQQATATLEEELRTARAELASRHQELDARIQQLGLLIKQLHTADRPAPMPTQVQPQPAVRSKPTQHAVPTPQRAAPSRPTARVAPVGGSSIRRLRQAERWGIVALLAAGMGVGIWGAARLVRPPKSRATTPAAHRRSPVASLLGSAAPGVVYVVDSTLAAPTPADTTDASLYSVDPEPATVVPTTATQAPARPPADSAAAPMVAPPPPTAPDSAATLSPTP